MQVSSQTAGLGAQVFKLTWMNVGTFNVVKYVVMTYVIGVMWSSAHVRLVETKRYLSLWYTGQFSVAAWGSSRNNLFSGCNFEALWTALRHHFSFSEEEEQKGEFASSGSAEGKASLRCVFFEIVSIGFVVLIACAEATSEFYTDNVEHTTFTFDQRISPVRRNSSDLFIGRYRNAADVPDLLFARRCTKYIEGKVYVSRPNLIVERTFPRPRTSELSRRYDLSRLCLRDERDESSRTEVIHTLLESQTNSSFLNGTQDYWTSRLKTKIYRVKYGAFLSVPLFYNDTLENREKPQSLLLQVELDGINFTCTRLWCLRLEGDAYEVVFLVDGIFDYVEVRTELSFTPSRIRKSIRLRDRREGMLPFRIHSSSVRLLGRDRFMRAPPVTQMETIEEMENLIHWLALGYTYGWATSEHRNQTVIIEKRTKIVPSVQVGYFVSICAILLCSTSVLLCHFIASGKRKITGLVGEHAFIERWHGHSRRNGLSDRTQRRANMIAFRSPQGVARLQPPVGICPSPLSDVDVMSEA